MEIDIVNAKDKMSTETRHGQNARDYPAEIKRWKKHRQTNN